MKKSGYGTKENKEYNRKGQEKHFFKKTKTQWKFNSFLKTRSHSDQNNILKHKNIPSEYVLYDLALTSNYSVDTKLDPCLLKTYQKRHWIALLHRKWQKSIYSRDFCFIFKKYPTIKKKQNNLDLYTNSLKT